jgi:hypothetical protein
MNRVIRQDFFNSAAIIQAEPLPTILPKGCNIETDMVVGGAWREHNSNFRFCNKHIALASKEGRHIMHRDGFRCSVSCNTLRIGGCGANGSFKFAQNSLSIETE